MSPSLSPSLAWQALLAKKVCATDDSPTGFGRFLVIMLWMETLPDPDLALAIYPWRQLEQLAVLNEHRGRPSA